MTTEKKYPDWFRGEKRKPKKLEVPDDFLTYGTDQAELFYNPKNMTRGEIKARQAKIREEQARERRKQQAIDRDQKERFEVVSREAERAAAIEAQRLRRPKRKYDDD